MYKFVIFFTLTLSVSSKIVNFELDNDANGIFSFDNIGVSYYKRLALADSRPLWVLSLKDDLMNVSMRLGSMEENDYFNYHAEPLLLNSGKKLARVKKDDPSNPKKISDPSNVENNQSQNEDANYSEKDILEIINKFLLTIKLNYESHPYLSESDPSIDLYFKGDYTLVIMSYGSVKIQYLINPPSPLPTWFYEAHDTKSEVQHVPEAVKIEFYKTLLPFLQRILAHPI